MIKFLRIATRKSPLALWQAKYVAKSLKYFYPKIKIKFIPMLTKGDKINNFKIKSKQLFVKELEIALLKNKADIAVHSVKDMSVTLPKGLGLIAVCKRENPLDAFISNNYNNFHDLPKNAIIGTSSQRRISQIKALRSDLIIKDLRGNIHTRLKKLDKNQYTAIILAVAGLKRLGLEKRICHIFSEEKILPAVGQGAIGIECGLKNNNIINLISSINHHNTSICIKAERAMHFHLSIGCHVPVGCYAIIKKNVIWLRGLISSLDGKKVIKEESTGNFLNAEKIGIDVAKKLINKGAKNILLYK